MSIANKFWRMIGERIVDAFEQTTDDATPVDNNNQAAGDDESVRQEDESHADVPNPLDTAHSLFDKAQIDVTWDKPDDKSQSGTFAYQGGHFMIRVWKTHPYAQITMPAIFSVGIRDIDVVRNVMNRVNMESLFVRIINTTNDADSETYCHAISFVYMDEVSDRRVKNITDALTACFIARRDIDNYFNEHKASGMEDMQVDMANNERDIYLMGEQAWKHDGKHVRLAGDDVPPFTVNEMLRHIFDWQDVEHVGMCSIVGGDTSRLDAAGDFNPVDVLMSEGGAVLAREAVLVLDVQRKNYDAYAEESVLHRKRTPVTVTAMMRVTHADDSAVYVRVTLAREGTEPGYMPAAQHPDLRGDAVTFNIARDLKGEQGRRQEFDCVMKDALDKVAHDREDELTDIQDMLLANDVNYAQGYHLYWGMTYVRNCRYYEALTHFLSVYTGQLPNLCIMKRRAQKAFYDLMYHIGLCYARMGQTDRAFYYLDVAVQHAKNNTCVVEMINCLVNAADPRAESLLNSVIANIQEKMNDEDDDEDVDIDAMQSYLNFINMRRAYLYVSQSRWKEAREILNELMKIDETRTFAMNELAYIATATQTRK